MSEVTYAPALAFVLAHEGGYTNDPRDSGGATNMGITIPVLSAWRGETCLPSDVRRLEKDEAGAIYHAKYWNACRCAELPAGPDLCVFDGGVNTGVGRSIKALQACVGVTADGVLGPKSMAAIAAADPVWLVNALCDARAAFYRGLATFDTFGRGWLVRVEDCRRAALGMVVA